MPSDVVDGWMQHPTLRHSNHEMFDSLRRWMGMTELFSEPLSLEVTIGAMDEGGVRTGLIAAWYGPEGSLIDNDEVSAFVSQLLFGTNYPMMSAARALARLDELDLGDEVAALFLRENARRLFRL